jgi:SAM-dependent methyltransferase
MYENKSYWNKLVGNTMQLKEVGWPQWTEAYNQARYWLAAKQTKSVLKKLIQSNKKIKVLEIGCGVGFWTNFILQHLPNASYTGVDISEQAINKLKTKFKNNPNANFICLDITNINTIEQQYDLVICMEVLLHIVLPGSWQNAIEFIGKSACTNGYVLISDPFMMYNKAVNNKTENNFVHTLDEYKIEFNKTKLSLLQIIGRTFLLDNNIDFPLPILNTLWKWFFKFYKKILSIPFEPLGWLLGINAIIIDFIFLKIWKKGFGSRLMILQKQ